MAHSKTKIIWLSDIHLREAYKRNVQIAPRVNNIFTKLIECIVEQQSPADYILISGDIAFSGAIADYDYFREVFLIKLYEAYKEKEIQNIPKIITIPGNHDIFWQEVSHLENYIGTFNSANSNFAERKQFYNENSEFFKNSFSNYSSSLSHKRQKGGGKINLNAMMTQFFKLDPPKKSPQNIYVDPDYSQDRLFGFFVDYSRSIIFVLLNTAWYSIGDNFNNLLVEEDPSNLVGQLRRKYKNKNDFEKDVISLLNIKSKMVEFGNQIAGAEDFPIKALQAKILANPKFTVLSVAHHPMGWLSWSELYSYSSSNVADQALSHILNYTDILLTGHEHVPVSKKAEKDMAGFYHLKAGMLMEDNIESNGYFEHSRFSVLEIDNYRDGCDYKETKYLFDKSNSKWERIAEETGILNTREHRLSRERETYILQNFEKFQINKFLATKLGISIDKITIGLLKKVGDHAFCTTVFHDKVARACYLVKEGLVFFDKTSGAIKSQKTADFISQEIKSLARNYPDFEIKVHFIFLDIIVTAELKNILVKTTDTLKTFDYPEISIDNTTGVLDRNKLFEKSTEETYTDIVRFSEQKFNNFRNEYFNYYEGMFDPNDSEQKNTFKIISKIKFVFDVLSYWSFEEYINWKETLSLSQKKPSR